MSLRYVSHAHNRIFFNFQPCIENFKPIADVRNKSKIVPYSLLCTHRDRNRETKERLSNIFHKKDNLLTIPSPFKLFLWQHIWCCNSGPEHQLSCKKKVMLLFCLQEREAERGEWAHVITRPPLLPPQAHTPSAMGVYAQLKPASFRAFLQWLEKTLVVNTVYKPGVLK